MTRFEDREAIIKIEQAQEDFRVGYVNGAPGVLVSGLAWLAGGGAWLRMGPEVGFVVLFVGGILIFPLSLAISRAFGAPLVAKANPLNSLGFETTVPLFAGLLIAWLLLPRAPELAFAAFAMVVGARYFAFSTLYRERAYWLLGALLFSIGYAYAASSPLPLNVAIAIGLAELLFAAVLFSRWRRFWANPQTDP